MLHTSKRCLRKDDCDAVWTGRHPTTGDVADLLLLGMRRYMPFTAGNNSVIGRKHRLKPGIVSNQNSWPSLRAGHIPFEVEMSGPSSNNAFFFPSPLLAATGSQGTIVHSIQQACPRHKQRSLKCFPLNNPNYIIEYCIIPKTWFEHFKRNHGRH